MRTRRSRVIVVPTGQSCQSYLQIGRIPIKLEELHRPEHLGQLLARYTLQVQVILAGLDAHAAWIDNALDLVDILVIPEPWLAAAPRSAPDRRARLADMHAAAPITQLDCDPQLRLAIPF